MSLLSVVQAVCPVVGVTVPTSVFAQLTSNRTMQEMVALANEMAQRICYDTREWTLLKLQATYKGDGAALPFNLPTNFKRMLKTANVWRSTSSLQPMTFIPDLDVWTQRRSAGWESAWGEWIIYGGQIHFSSAMGTGITAKHAYL